MTTEEGPRPARDSELATLRTRTQRLEIALASVIRRVKALEARPRADFDNAFEQLCAEIWQEVTASGEDPDLCQ